MKRHYYHVIFREDVQVFNGYIVIMYGMDFHVWNVGYIVIMYGMDFHVWNVWFYN